MPKFKKIKKTTKKTKKEKAKEKKIKAKEKKLKAVKKPVVKPTKYLEAVGKRKTAVARIRLWTQGLQAKARPLEKTFLVNKKPLESYFPTSELQKITKASLEKMKCLDRFRISAIVKGGGLSAQAEAVRQGIAKALVLFNPDFRKRLKKAGFLTRDARIRERKKFGLKRARRAPQWQKR
jgi:small subunit ribosomal protein S9